MFTAMAPAMTAVICTRPEAIFRDEKSDCTADFENSGQVAKRLPESNLGELLDLSFENLGRAAKFLAELRRKLPFEAEVAFCDGSDLIRLEMENPFGTEPSRPDVVRFVSILSKAGRGKVSLPVAFRRGGEWFVRIIGSKNRLVFGVYRRHMKTIGYLGQIDELFGAPATTRSWNTILSVLRILKAQERGKVTECARLMAY